MKSKKIVFVVEDDRHIRSLLKQILEQEGFNVHECADGSALRRSMAQQRPDLVLLDLMLPGEGGLAICRTIAGSVPVIIISAKGETIDRVLGLELGADDYLPKPFDPRELLARIRAVLRRRELQENAPANAIYVFAGWRVDTASRSVAAPNGQPVRLTSGEFDLLRSFVEEPQRVLSRDHLLVRAKGRAQVNLERTVDVCLSRLKQRMIEADPASVDFFCSIRGAGYFFTPQVRRL